MAEHNTIGEIGESIAAEWLGSRGHAILERNYREKWGEIDVISRAEFGVHFVEVKTVSYGTLDELELSVSRETWRPEEMVYHEKLRRLGRAIETWLAKNRYEGAWQIDVLTVRIVPREKFAKVKLIENVILEE